MSEQSSRRTSVFSLAAEAALALAILSTVASLGGVLPFSNWALVVTSFSALGLSSWGAHRQRQGIRLPLFAAMFLFTAVVCAVQLVPLPAPLLALLSPVAHELHSANLAPLGLSTTRPISIDPPSTFRELARALGYAALVLAAAQLSRSRRSRQRLVMAIAGIGAFVALVGLGHLLFNGTSLFGLYTFSTPHRLITFFGNPNHLAGFLTLTATVTLGLALATRDRPLQALVGLGFVLQGAVALLSLSRAGVGFFVLAQVLFAGLVLLGRGKKRERIAVIVGALVCVLAVSGYLAWDALSTELETTNTFEKVRASKVSLWPDFALSARDFVRMGMGRGTFELGYPRSQPEPFFLAYTHPENLVLQLASESGALVTLVLIALALFGVVQVFRREDLTVTDRALLAGVCALVLHNLFDFSLEFPAVTSALCLALGILSRPLDGSEPRKRSVSIPRPMVFASALAAVALLALWGARSTFHEAEARLASLMAAHTPAAALEAEALPLIDRHPADALLFAQVGLAYSMGSDASVVKTLAYVNRALRLDPWHIASHHAAGRALIRAGKRTQGFLEYRLALQSSRSLNHEVLLTEALRLALTVDELRRFTPEDVGSASEIATRLWGSGRQTQAEALLREVLPVLPPTPETAELWLQLSSYRLAQKDYEGALELIAKADALRPGNLSTALRHSDVLFAMGRKEEARALLESHITRFPGDVRLHLALAQHLLASGDARRALDACSRGRPFISSQAERSTLFSIESSAYRMQGRLAKSLEAMQSLARLSPQEPGPRYGVSDLYREMGRMDEARKWLAEAISLDGPNAAEQQKGRTEAINDGLKKLSVLREKLQRQTNVKEPAPEDE